MTARDIVTSCSASSQGHDASPLRADLAAMKPRVLFCTSEIPQSINAGSMQLYRALQGYPGDRLMVLGVPPENDAELLPCIYEPLHLVTYRLACTRFRGWTSGLNAANQWFEPQMQRSVRLAQAFGPDVIVTVMDKLSYYKHAWALSRRLQVPLVTITMDDPQTFERAHPVLEGAFVRFLRRIYGDAAVSLAVSPEMCEYIAGRFGKASSVFYCSQEGIVARSAAESSTLMNPPHLTLAYAGSLGLGYRDGILAMLDAIEAAQARLHVYTRDQHCLIEHPAIVNRGFFPSDQLWPVVQSECDVMVLPYAFEGDMTRVYRTHFPTKLSEYCWAGMPMLLVGPPFGTGIRWGQRHPDAALTATSPDAHELGPILARLQSDGALRQHMAAGAAITARDEFDIDIVRRNFVADLQRAASAPRAVA
jgi:hypothetical protein